MSLFVFTRADISWFGQAATVNCIIECTRDRLRDLGRKEFSECIDDIYRPLDLEGQVFIELSNACSGCFNYFYAMCRQAMFNFPETPAGKSVDPQSYVRVIITTWEGLLRFLEEDPRFDRGHSVDSHVAPEAG